MKTQILKKTMIDAKNFLLFMISDILSVLKKTHIKKRTILLVRLDAIGDFILWSAAAGGFRKLYPVGQYKITLLANQVWANIAKSLPYWDDIWVLNRRRFMLDPIYRFCMLRKIHNAGFETAVQPTFSREFFMGDAIIKASGAKEKIGPTGDCFNIRPYQKRISDQWYTHLVRASNFPLMELERNAEFMRGLGLTDFKADLPELPFDKGISYPSIPENYYVICPGAMLGEKMWPIEKFARLSGKIYEQAGLTGVACGGHEEKKIGQRLETMSHAPLINMIGKTTLNQMLLILKNAYFLIGNDSGAVHIAVAVSTPSVCILGGGHYGRFMPYDIGVRTNRPLPRVVAHKMDCFGCNWECSYSNKKNKPAPCIYNISVEEVFAALQPLMKKQHQLGFS